MKLSPVTPRCFVVGLTAATAIVFLGPVALLTAASSVMLLAIARHDYAQRRDYAAFLARRVEGLPLAA